MGKSKNMVIRVTVYCLLVLFLIAIVNLQIRMNETKDTIEQQKKQIVILEDDIAKDKILLEEEKDDEYYERHAREHGYIFRDEIIFYNEYAE